MYGREPFVELMSCREKMMTILRNELLSSAMNMIAVDLTSDDISETIKMIQQIVGYDC